MFLWHLKISRQDNIWQDIVSWPYFYRTSQYLLRDNNLVIPTCIEILYATLHLWTRSKWHLLCMPQNLKVKHIHADNSLVIIRFWISHHFIDQRCCHLLKRWGSLLVLEMNRHCYFLTWYLKRKIWSGIEF